MDTRFIAQIVNNRTQNPIKNIAHGVSISTVAKLGNSVDENEICNDDKYSGI
jgi:hypothetical protein